MNDEKTEDPHTIIAGLVRDHVELALSTADICFLTILHFQSKKMVSFPDDYLLDVYEQVGDVVETGSNNGRYLAARSIQHLRNQRLLARVDTAGTVRAGDYSLTQLARGLVQFYIEDETLTRESLILLTGTLIGVLAEVLKNSRIPKDHEDWPSVMEPLRITVSTLVGAIDRRQRGLDSEQERIKSEIEALLAAEWGAAVDRCLALLEETTATLAELSELLMRECGKLSTLLMEIEETAAAAGEMEAAKVPREVLLEIDRITEWGSVRFSDWTNYYQWTQRYLREIVHIDPDRRLSRRLRDCLNAWPDVRYRLVCARTPTIMRLREMLLSGSIARVARPRISEESDLEIVENNEYRIDVEGAVQRRLFEGIVKLSELTASVITEFPGEGAFTLAGMVAVIVGKKTSVSQDSEPQWAPVNQDVEVEEALLEGREP
jgi:chromosome partition protein MukF